MTKLFFTINAAAFLLATAVYLGFNKPLSAVVCIAAACVSAQIARK